MAAVTLVSTTDVGLRSLPPASPATRPSGDAEPALELLDEPLELVSELRREAFVRPAEVRTAAPQLLARYAIETWASQLDALGIAPDVVAHAFESSRREIWLWIDGDRRWSQLARHLGARVLRRARD